MAMENQIDHEPINVRSIKSNSTEPTFPVRLYEMLEDADRKHFSGVVSWLPDGNTFKIHRPREFVDNIMPKYFKKQTQYKSFSRQLNYYNFKFINDAAPSQYGNTGGYYHPLFSRGRKDRCYFIGRYKRTRKACSGPYQEATEERESQFLSPSYQLPRLSTTATAQDEGKKNVVLSNERISGCDPTMKIESNRISSQGERLSLHYIHCDPSLIEEGRRNLAPGAWNTATVESPSRTTANISTRSLLEERGVPTSKEGLFAGCETRTITEKLEQNACLLQGIMGIPANDLGTVTATVPYTDPQIDGPSGSSLALWESQEPDRERESSEEVRSLIATAQEATWPLTSAPQFAIAAHSKDAVDQTAACWYEEQNASLLEFAQKASAAILGNDDEIKHYTAKYEH